MLCNIKGKFLEKYYRVTEALDQLFYSKTSGATSTDTEGKLISVKGNTVKYNQLVQNGNFEDTSGWTVAGSVSFSVSDNILSLTASATGDYRLDQSLSTMVVGHKYYFCVDAKSDTGNVYVARFFYGGASNVSSFYASDTNWNHYSCVVECVSNTFRIARLVCNVSGVTNQYKNCMIIDLTALGMENYTVAEVEEWLEDNFDSNYLPYSTGTLLNFKGTGLQTLDSNDTLVDTLSIPTLNYFSDGMMSVNDVFDELTQTKAIQRLGIVDLGSLDWFKDSNSSRFHAYISDIFGSSIWGTNLITSNGLSFNSDISLLYPSVDCVGSFSNHVYIYMSSFSSYSASDFKSAMSGVYLIYELATPVETDIHWDSTFKVEENCTEELQTTLTSTKLNCDEWYLTDLG